jgi:hypothetical protein
MKRKLQQKWFLLKQYCSKFWGNDREDDDPFNNPYVVF